MNKKKGFLPILIYVIFLIVVIEGSVRLAFFVPQVYEKIQVRDDFRWHRLWINRAHITGKNFDIYDSSKGWKSKSNIKDMKVFGNKVLNTNSKGFRGKNEYQYSKDPGKVRILLLGDSFTFGQDVSDDETYSYHLQKLIPHAEVINTGVHGYGHDQMLILLKEEGIKYKPDIIILGFLPMDMPRNLLNFRDYAKPKFVFENNKLQLTRPSVPRPEEVIKKNRWNWAKPRIFELASIISYRLKQSSGVYTKEKKEITTAILTEITKEAEGIDAILLFAYLPSGEEITAHSLLTTDVVEGENILSAMCQTINEVKCFSTRPFFREEMANGATFKSRGHWGPAGHLAVAGAIYRHLSDEGHLTKRVNLEKSTL